MQHLPFCRGVVASKGIKSNMEGMSLTMILKGENLQCTVDWEEWGRTQINALSP